MLASVVKWIADRMRAVFGFRVHLIWFAIAVAGALCVGVVFGDWASDNNFKDRVVAAVQRKLNDYKLARIDVTRQTVEWRPLFSNLHDLETATIKLSPFDTHGRGGAIEEIAGSVIFASPVGQIGYLTPGLELNRIDLQVPLNEEGLRKNEISRRPGFLDQMFRVLDLLVVERSDREYDLYVSHHRFADNCFEVVVSRARLIADGGKIRAESPDWEQVFVASPCLPPKDTGMVFEGNESGGRLVLRDAQTILLSLGDLQFNGVDDPRALAQDPKADLGKIIAIDIKTHQTHIVSSGHRNPQGLLVARDGRVWETEHGPQGGDEINLIREGADYGWPTVTYGVLYGYGGPRRDWPLNPVQGAHDGFERPAFAFVPSISISNLVQPDPREFPLWRNHLLVGSLYSGQALYLAQVEDDRIVYAERLPINKVARDMITLHDGRIAILTDAGELIFLRNADRGDAGKDGAGGDLTVTASDDVVRYRAERPDRPMTAAAVGEEQFTFACSSCHSLSGAAGVGPPLNGVAGRPIGGVKQFAYSPALTGQDGVWTRRRLTEFLLDPDKQHPGTTMPKPTLGGSREIARSIAIFLETSK